MPDAAALLRVLADERRAIRLGNYDALPDLAARKSALEAVLSDLRLTRAQAERIATDARRNAELLHAAIEGVRAARVRIEELRSAGQGLRVYTASGVPQEVGRATGRLTRKA